MVATLMRSICLAEQSSSTIDSRTARAGLSEVGEVCLERAAAARFEVDPAQPRRRYKHVVGVRPAMQHLLGSARSSRGVATCAKRALTRSRPSRGMARIAWSSLEQSLGSPDPLSVIRQLAAPAREVSVQAFERIGQFVVIELGVRVVRNELPERDQEPVLTVWPGRNARSPEARSRHPRSTDAGRSQARGRASPERLALYRPWRPIRTPADGRSCCSRSGGHSGPRR